MTARLGLVKMEVAPASRNTPEKIIRYITFRFDGGDVLLMRKDLILITVKIMVTIDSNMESIL